MLAPKVSDLRPALRSVAEIGALADGKDEARSTHLGNLVWKRKFWTFGLLKKIPLRLCFLMASSRKNCPEPPVSVL
jgi:hypothetical protein